MSWGKLGLAHCLNNLISVEILSGGESEGGSVEETVCQETQTPRAVSNSHADLEKSVVRLPYTRDIIPGVRGVLDISLGGEVRPGPSYPDPV